MTLDIYRAATVEEASIVSPQQRWFILRVKNRRASQIIKEIGEEFCWRPTLKRLTKPARKKQPVVVEVALIPGWIFVRESQWGLWMDLEGVYGILKYGRLGTLWLEDQELSGLREMCHKEQEPKQSQKTPKTPKAPRWRPEVGAKVTLKGLFEGNDGVVTRDLGGDNFRVELKNLNIDIHLSALKPIVG